MTPQLLIVVDTEEEFDWSAPFSRDSRATTSSIRLTSIRSVLARDIAATPRGALRDFYMNLDARYQRVISSLQTALAAPTTGPFPDGILSDSFSSSVAQAR